MALTMANNSSTCSNLQVIPLTLLWWAEPSKRQSDAWRQYRRMTQIAGDFSLLLWRDFVLQQQLSRVARPACDGDPGRHATTQRNRTQHTPNATTPRLPTHRTTTPQLNPTQPPNTNTATAEFLGGRPTPTRQSDDAREALHTEVAQYIID